MTVKSAAGVLVLGPVYVKTEEGFKQVPTEFLGMTKKQISACLSYAMKSTRNLHIRLNEWDRIEIDIQEHQENYKVLDVNFILKGVETHRVLDIRIEKGFPTSFASVCVSPIN